MGVETQEILEEISEGVIGVKQLQKLTSKTIYLRVIEILGVNILDYIEHPGMQIKQIDNKFLKLPIHRMQNYLTYLIPIMMQSNCSYSLLKVVL